MRVSDVPERPGFTRRRLLATAAAGAGALALTAVGVSGASPMATWPKGLDSNNDPDPGQVAAAGYVFVSYYLTGPGSLTAA